jgi:hypothetical protein
MATPSRRDRKIADKLLKVFTEREDEALDVREIAMIDYELEAPPAIRGAHVIETQGRLSNVVKALNQRNTDESMFHLVTRFYFETAKRHPAPEQLPECLPGTGGARKSWGIRRVTEQNDHLFIEHERRRQKGWKGAARLSIQRLSDAAEAALLSVAESNSILVDGSSEIMARFSAVFSKMISNSDELRSLIRRTYTDAVQLIESEQGDEGEIEEAIEEDETP